MRQPVRVVLADDHDAFVEGLGMVLAAEGDLEVVALAGDGASALQAVLTHHPDVLVVDTQCPARRSPSWSAWSARPSRRPGLLLLAEDARLAPSSRPDPGGHAGMTRPSRPASWPRHPGGGRRLPGDLGRPARRRSVPAAPADQPPDRPERNDHAELLLRSLSERERQILGLLARGYSNGASPTPASFPQNGPHPRTERAGQAGGTLQAGGGRTGRAPGAGPHRGPDHLGATVPQPGGRRRPWVPVGSIVVISSRPAPPPSSASCSPGASGLGRPQRPSRQGEPSLRHRPRCRPD